MNVEAVLELPVRLARTAAPSQADPEVYPPTVRSLLLSWHASRLADYLDDPSRVRVLGQETGARV